MKAIPGTLQGGGAAFTTTHWSVVEACGEDETADIAVAQLCQDYWPPLYTFARRRGNTSADAQDLVQGFFAYLLQTKAYAQTDRNKGKFRSFLLACFKNYMADAWDKMRAAKRGGDFEFVLLDDEVEAAEAVYRCVPSTLSLDAEQQYEQAWAAALVARALERTQKEFDQAENRRGRKAGLFSALKPFLTGGVSLPSQDEVATQLDLSIDTLRSHLSRLRSRYRAFLREEVARTIGIAEDVDEELRHLCRTVIQTR
ncbi:MAG TPA: sigma-70 family RNA polymerase sigma factor [Candidatus Udaeobacter sp.]|nr:sigma-70 family RNA polymerase sigma factor [Candidatus Udaeobacter sp.]